MYNHIFLILCNFCTPNTLRNAESTIVKLGIQSTRMRAKQTSWFGKTIWTIYSTSLITNIKPIEWIGGNAYTHLQSQHLVRYQNKNSIDGFKNKGSKTNMLPLLPQTFTTLLYMTGRLYPHLLLPSGKLT